MSLLSSCKIGWKYTRLPTVCKNIKNCNIPLDISKRRFSQNDQKADKHDAVDNFTTFSDRINLRKTEAKRTLLVQVQSAKSYKELYSYCSLFGQVNQLLHYSNGVEPLHFILVEFSEESEVANMLVNSSHLEENQGVPTNSHFLWFRASKQQRRLKQSKSAFLGVEHGTKILGDEEIKNALHKCDDVSHQMEILYSLTRLNDLGTRLRFITALQIEKMISGMFPYAVAYPFGSSVNGYGKMGCDLDLVLRLSDKKMVEDSRLVFHCKAPFGSDRSVNQRQMEVLGDMIHLFLPGCGQVRRILQARVPIIKYHQQLTDIECDLSMSNMSGVYMSDFLYLMGEIDQRVRPLVFTIRKWASLVGLTNSSPGRWISNFSLTLLVLAFLQRPLSDKAILPSLNELIKMAGPEDKYITEDGINCTFLRDLGKYRVKTENKSSLEQLLKQFFEFYSHFDFSSKAVCLNEAVAIVKPEFSPMYIVNPLEKGLNVSKNVSLDEVERFQSEARTAAWILESEEKTQSWGLLSIFERAPSITHPLNNTKQGRLMEVSALFQEQDIDYKNGNLKKEVASIRKVTRDTIKNLQDSFKEQQKSKR